MYEVVGYHIFLILPAKNCQSFFDVSCGQYYHINLEQIIIQRELHHIKIIQNISNLTLLTGLQKKMIIKCLKHRINIIVHMYTAMAYTLEIYSIYKSQNKREFDDTIQTNALPLLLINDSNCINISHYFTIVNINPIIRRSGNGHHNYTFYYKRLNSF